MIIDGCECVLDCLSKFHNTLYLHGWFHSLKDRLKAIDVRDRHSIKAISRVGVHHGGVSALGPDKGFFFQSLRDADQLDLATEVVFTTEQGKELTTTLRDLSIDRRRRYPIQAMAQRFYQELSGRGAKKMLDIGGRDRSKVDRSKDFPSIDVTVVDILPGSNVDIVGDAHELSSILPANTFDAVFSNSVWEHLAMPWRVVVEMNRVMKTGGIGLIASHQTIGLHDLPWDFFRFSDSAWDGLLNEATGFRIIERAMDSEQFVIPFIYRPGKEEAEKSAGFEGSAVMFEKIGEPRVDWQVRVVEITNTMYPHTDDGSMAGTEERHLA